MGSGRGHDFTGQALLAAVMLCFGENLCRPGEELPAMPLPINEADSANHRWLNKPVLEARLLDDMEATNHWSHVGEGEMSFTTERAKDGKQSVRLRSPTRTDKPGKVAGRPFGEAVVRRDVAGEDWGRFNRLSFWVHPHLPGFQVISLLIKLHNEGAEKVPDDYGREGLNYFLVKPDEWNHVVWEIPHLARDRVTAVDFIYRLQGNEPGATPVAQFDLDLLELQRVEPDYFEGWDVAPGKISYSHGGYASGATKTALAGRLPAKTFKVVDAKTRKTVLTKEIKTVKSALGEFQALDFSEILQPGLYFLQAGELKTPPFEIGENVWRDSIWKTLNFFYCQRCGAKIAGIHGVCHRDWQATHGERTIFINGGWHDAGDLSQGLVNTAEGAYAMFGLAERLRDEDPALSKRLIEEARWGLAWILKTRFGDGYRVTWGTMDYWTDGKLGTVDDTFGEVRDGAFDNFPASTTEAIAARLLKVSDARLAEKSLQAARDDWRFAFAKVKNPGVELASAGALSSLELFKATEEMAYASKAFEMAQVILQSQQREWLDWSTPLTGFFYTHPDRRRILHYLHLGHDQAPIEALAALCAAFPEHADWMKWYSAVVLHSEYLKAVARFTEPYGMLPASIYDLEESNEARFRGQVLNGVKLDQTHYLRLFPVWFDFRGNSGTLLSQTKALSTAARLRGSVELADLVQKQLQWHVGRNPFCQSLMVGEGHDYAPQYTAMSGDMAGSLPVGIQTRGDRDLPYWPAANCYNYKEVWVHPASRWLAVMRDAAGPATVSGQVEPKSVMAVEFDEARTHQRFMVKPNQKTGLFAIRLPEGRYTARLADQEKVVAALPGGQYHVDLQKPFDFAAAVETAPDGAITISVKAQLEGPHRFALRTYNLRVRESDQTAELKFGGSKTLKWHAKKNSPKEPWVAVIVPDGNLAERKEIVGMR